MPATSFYTPPHRPATIVAIGGGIVQDPERPDRLQNPGHILDRIGELAQLPGKAVIVVSLGFEDASKSDYYIETYGREFTERGAAKIIGVSKLEDLSDPAVLEALRSPDTALVHFCGGDQKRFMAALQGIDFADVLKDRVQRGGIVVSGNSAGAHILSDYMINEEDTHRRGLGLTPLVIDTHVDVDSHIREKTGRVRGSERVAQMLEQTAATRGIALPKGVAVAITGDTLEVFGLEGKEAILRHQPAMGQTTSLDGRHIQTGECLTVPSGWAMAPQRGDVVRAASS